MTTPEREVLEFIGRQAAQKAAQYTTVGGRNRR